MKSIPMSYEQAAAIVKQQLLDSAYLASVPMWMEDQFEPADEMQALFDLADEKRDAP